MGGVCSSRHVAPEHMHEHDADGKYRRRIMDRVPPDGARHALAPCCASLWSGAVVVARAAQASRPEASVFAKLSDIISRGSISLGLLRTYLNP